MALLCVIAVTVHAHVGVNDDYYLNAPVSFECPLVLPTTDDIFAGNATDDGGAGDDYLGAKLAPDYPAFTFFYCWMTVFTALPLLYFAYNNRFAPVGEVKPFVPEGKLVNLLLLLFTLSRGLTLMSLSVAVLCSHS